MARFGWAGCGRLGLAGQASWGRVGCVAVGLGQAGLGMAGRSRFADTLNVSAHKKEPYHGQEEKS